MYTKEFCKKPLQISVPLLILISSKHFIQSIIFDFRIASLDSGAPILLYKNNLQTNGDTYYE